MKINHATSGAAGRKVLLKNAKNNKWILCLYVAGHTPRSVAALINLKTICKEQFIGKYIIKEIDLFKHPKLGREEQIVAIPTLKREFPLPMKQIIGDLSNKELLLAGLNS